MPGPSPPSSPATPGQVRAVIPATVRSRYPTAAGTFASDGYDLRAIHAWEDPGYFYPVALGQYPRETLDAMNAERRRRLDSLLAPWHNKHPDTFVETQVLTSPPSKALVDSSRLADLLVIGARRQPDNKGMHLGGLAHTILHHAHCPIAVVPESK